MPVIYNATEGSRGHEKKVNMAGVVSLTFTPKENDNNGNKAFLLSSVKIMDNLLPELAIEARFKVSEVFKNLLVEQRATSRMSQLSDISPLSVIADGSNDCIWFYLGATVTNINGTREEIKRRINMGNACYYSVEKLLSSSLLSKNLKVRIYKTVILPVLLYGCETWTLTPREEHRLKVFENKVLRKIFGAKRDEVTGEWRKLHNTELHALYSSPNIIRNIKSRRLRWAGHVARMGESRNAYSVSWETGGKKTFGEAETYMGG
ncbi:hypothetical protein ANN_18197 [Periplaneta americana]|uniref:Uncharacterized protein n=1 Tax=Periplaneta americana TaxID=6978 RepID=A0ABQ8SN29_PERAM|nr:hypothetical protein ANN_18197 [Periplaneta americana]